MISTDRLTRDYIEQPLGKLEKPAKEDLTYLYIELGMSVEELSKYFNKGSSSVARWLQKYDLKKGNIKKDYVTLTEKELSSIDLNRLSRDFRKKPWVRGEQPLKEDFSYLYDELNWSADAVATYIGLSPGRVQEIVAKFGIRKTKEQHNQARQHEVNRKYGVEHVSQIDEVKKKKERTCMARHGVKSILCKKEVREDAMTEKYGEKHALKIPKFKKKQEDSLEKTTGHRNIYELQDEAKAGVMAKYGVDNVFKLPEMRTTARDSFKSKYGVEKYAYLHITHMENMNRDFWLRNFVNTKKNYFDVAKCAKYHNIQHIAVCNKLKEFNITVRHKWSSIQEINIANLFNKSGLTCNTKDRKLIAPLELDLVVPDVKLAIEYDGLLFHSQGITSNTLDYEVSEDYHINKTNKCAEAGYQLLHIFENEWLDPVKRRIWESVIESKIGTSARIYARNTIVQKISDVEAYNFCEQNHLQGGVHASHNYGLLYGDDLVAVMTFSKSRYNKNYDWELIRSCTLVGNTVVGGASKLLKAFRKDNKGSIISYANRRWSNGNVYEKLGFKYTGETQQNYFYFKTRDGSRYPLDYKLHSRIEFQKHKLKDILKNFDSEKTELENMYLNGYRTIYDCGNLVYTLVD